MDARAELNKQNSSGTKSTEKKSTTAPQSNTFKRIAIQEEDEDDEEEEEEKGKTEIKETEITTEKSKGVSKLEQTNSTEKKSDGTLSKGSTWGFFRVLITFIYRGREAMEWVHERAWYI